MNFIRLCVLIFLLPLFTWASDCKGGLTFLEDSSLEAAEKEHKLYGILEGYRILQKELESIKAEISIFCDSDISVNLSTSEFDFGRLVAGNLKINVNLLQNIFLAKDDSELSKLYTFAILGLTSYFEAANFHNTYASGLQWWRAESSAQVGRTGPLKDYNMMVLKGLIEKDPVLGFGMGVYRVLTGKELRDNNSDKLKYKQNTHPTPYEIATLLREADQEELAYQLDTVIFEYEYAHDKPEVIAP